MDIDNEAAATDVAGGQQLDPGSTHKRRKPVAAAWNWLTGWQNLGLILTIPAIGIVLYIGYRLINPPQWIFSVEAKSRIIELATPANKETRWRINHGYLCTRGKQELPPGKFAPIATGNTVCGGRRWSGYRILDPEQILVLSGTINVLMELGEDRSLFLALRTPPNRSRSTEKAPVPGDGKTDPLTSGAGLSFTDGSPDFRFNRDDKLRVNIIFPAPESKALVERVFPFTAETTIGRDINWAGSSLLTEGNISVYTSDESPDRRKRVDETKLLLGDQLRLYPMTRDRKKVYPKGFIRLESEKDYFDVIAFGAADHVRIERFGDNGYNFKPGKLRLLMNDQVLILISSIFIALVGVLTGIASVFGRKHST